MINDESTLKISKENLKPYDYEDICGFPVTDQMRLDAIYEGSTGFTNDGLSYLKLRGGNFTHVELDQYHNHEYPSLNYWFTLRNGQQIYFQISACNIENPDITLGKVSAEYFKIKPETGDVNYEHISVPGFPMVNTITMKSVLDAENYQGITDYYATLQSHVMFTSENVTFDPLWRDQVFQLMDYCNDIGSYEMNIVNKKIEWSFTVK